MIDPVTKLGAVSLHQSGYQAAYPILNPDGNQDTRHANYISRPD